MTESPSSNVAHTTPQLPLSSIVLGRWEGGLFYEQMPPKWSEDGASALHLSSYCSIIGRGLDRIEQSIDATRDYVFLQNKFYLEAFLEHLGYEDLPNYFTTDDLRLFAPVLLQCHKLKGTLVPLENITQFVFRDAPLGFFYVIDPPDLNSNLNIEVSMPVLDNLSIGNFTSYLQRKMRGLFYVLTRFVPFWLNLKILLSYSFIEIFDVSFNDSNYNFYFEFDYVEDIFNGGGQNSFSEETLIEWVYDVRQQLDNSFNLNRPVLNHNSLDHFKLNNNLEVVGLFSEGDVLIELF